MFGKDKKSETVYKTPFANSESNASINASINANSVSCAEGDRLRDLCNTVDSASMLAYKYASTRPSYSVGFAGPSLLDIYSICVDIRNNTAGYMNVLESIEYIVKALEARECPVDDCKKCKYYQPGNVEKCDTNRMLAEYLVNGEFVRGIRPKPIDKPEEK